MKIYIANKKSDFTKEQIDKLNTVGSVVFIEKKPFNIDLISKDDENKILMVDPDYVDWNFTNQTVDKIHNLKAIFVPSTSFSWFDSNYLRKKGVSLFNVSKYSTESVAEYAICLMLNVVKKLPLVIKNDWKIDYDKHLNWEVKGKTMGIVGLGNIGKRIAELGKSIGMNVVYWSKNSRDDRFQYLDLDELMKQADFIFPALAKNKETRQLISKERIDLMKPDSFIVSITSDEIFDFEYSQEKVREGKLAGVALELDDKSINDFKGNIWITPPIAWYTKEAVMEDFRIWVENVLSYAAGKNQNLVN